MRRWPVRGLHLRKNMDGRRKKRVSGKKDSGEKRGSYGISYIG
jgi:hypothetical protein